jgi:O-antigen/teichoic acid export membrane protein
LLLVPPIGVLACWNQLLTYAALRRQEFNASATAKVVQPVGYAAGALLIGQAHPSSVSLMLADAFGRASTALLLARALHMTRLDLAWPTFGVLRSVLRQNRELATVGLLAAIINAAGSAFTAALLLGLFGAAEAGQYSMVERLVGMPIGLLAGTLSQVFMANLSDSISRSDGNSAVKTFGRVLGMQILTGLPAAIALFVLVPWVLAQVLGPGWETAGEFARALIPVYLCAYIVGPLNMTLTVIGRQRLQLSWDCFRLLLTGGAWAFIWWSGLKSISALQAYAAASCLAYLSYVFLARRALRTWSGGTLKAS